MSEYRRRLWLIFFFGFSSGLPFLLVRGTLQAWMTDIHIDIKTIGLVSLVTWPFTLKVLWSPFIDHYRLPFLGKRRGWIFLTQILVALTLLMMSTFSEPLPLTFLLSGAFLVAVASATQDITLDGFRREIFTDEELGTATSFFVTGYRIAILCAGAGALYLSYHGVTWQEIYRLMAMLMLVGVSATFLCKEPPSNADAPRDLTQAIVLPIKNFLARENVLWIVLFILLYKLGDVMSTSLQTRFILGMGYSKKELADATKIYGFGAAILGGAAAGWAMLRISLNQALWLFGFLQSAMIAGFFFVAISALDVRLLVLAVAAESFAAALGTSAFIAYLGSLCDKRYSITQYAMLSGLMAAPATYISSLSGYMQAALGWPMFFAACIGLALPGMLVLRKIAPYQ